MDNGTDIHKVFSRGSGGQGPYFLPRGGGVSCPAWLIVRTKIGLQIVTSTCSSCVTVHIVIQFLITNLFMDWGLWTPSREQQ